MPTQDSVRTSAHVDALEISPDDVIRQLTDVLSKPVVAFIFGKDERTMTRWIENPELRLKPEDDRRARNTYQVYALLAPSEGPHTVRAWFMGMNPQLEDEAPAEGLAEGRYREVMAAARAYVNGG
ncbi:hypothetical protein C5E02_13075 [Rathayibacter rathayi]|uniref:hypothetical protein n=1 Tax=Rathayibacter rathayi TaxID=33887 RepID=UPI000CE78C6D|nr:hypothetical protein [Rathayibacter rathayi]PPH95915.1 hypothetical protein C5C43_14835 [Rathayibacter rathayi]PPI05332.1 hypothetical protein C5D23_14725 [Rathayibacter rathayi]PPI58632.1 hypothetical protein C5E02_13075 [Rathayibacter rathayi]